MEGQNKEALRIVAGNDFYLVVPLRRIVFGRDEYGDMVKRGERMELSACSRLVVNAMSDGGETVALGYVITPEDDSQLVVKVKGCRMTEGWWGVEVAGTYDGRRFRSYEKKVFKIVENNGKSYVYGEQYAGEASYQIDTMWTLYAQESYPFFQLNLETMELEQYGVVENGRMLIDDEGNLCMEVEGGSGGG